MEELFVPINFSHHLSTFMPGFDTSDRGVQMIMSGWRNPGKGVPAGSGGTDGCFNEA